MADEYATAHPKAKPEPVKVQEEETPKPLSKDEQEALMEERRLKNQKDRQDKDIAELQAKKQREREANAKVREAPSTNTDWEDKMERALSDKMEIDVVKQNKIAENKKRMAEEEKKKAEEEIKLSEELAAK